MAVEILETSKVVVRRPDRDELLAIRDGAWSYDELVEHAEHNGARIREAAKKSTLPRGVDEDAIETLGVQIIKGGARMKPDFEKARRFVEANHPPGTLLQCGITGSHFYGFPSADSDVDMKGIHLAPTEQLLGLDKPQESFDRLVIFEETEHDFTTHELSRALGLLLGGNGNLLERLLTPLQLVESEDVDALRELARGAISKRFIGHYRGFFKGCRREHENRRQAKSFVVQLPRCAYRCALDANR